MWFMLWTVMKRTGLSHIWRLFTRDQPTWEVYWSAHLPTLTQSHFLQTVPQGNYRRGNCPQCNFTHKTTTLNSIPGKSHSIRGVITWDTNNQGVVMRRSTSTHYIKEKWEKESELQLTTEDWHNICNIQQTTTSSGIWRGFCWKNTIRFFITLKTKSNFLRTQQICWRLCGEINAHHSHIFLGNVWKIKKHRDDLWIELKVMLGYELPKEFTVLYLGNLTINNVQCKDRYLVNAGGSQESHHEKTAQRGSSFSETLDGNSGQDLRHGKTYTYTENSAIGIHKEMGEMDCL